MPELSVRLAVQVCHAVRPGQIIMIDLHVAPGTTVEQAILQSGLLDRVKGLDLTGCRVGIWNKLKSFDTVVSERDRVEIYRPLIADPMDARRRRAEKARVPRA